MMKKAMKILSLAVGLAALAGCLPQSGGKSDSGSSGDRLKAVCDRGVIVFGVKTDAPPFGFQDKDGSFRGFDIDIARAVASVIGVKAQFTPVQSRDRIGFVKDGKVDAVIASMTITRAREKEVDFTIPYFQDGQGLLCRKDSDVKGYLDLKGRKVGAVAGATSCQNMKKAQPQCELVEFNDYNAGLEALLDGRVDALTSDTLILMGLLNNSDRKDSMELRGERFSVEPYGMAVQENQSRLRDRLNEAVMALWENGTWQDIFGTWFGEGSKYHTNIVFYVPVTP